VSVEAVDGGYDVGPAAELAAGAMRGVALPGRRIVVANIAGSYTAFDELCPHLSVPMSQGKLEGDCVTCVGHGSVFQLPGGEVRKWLGRRPGVISSLLSGKPTPIPTWPVDVVDERLIVRITT
jgi:nitrite reductase/ring-hydroxylating ferredoxin subunit